MCIPRFTSIGCCISYMHIYVPIVIYGVRLFIVVLQEVQCLECCLHVRIISSHVSFVYSFRFLRYLNVLPEGVYCFTRTTLFTTMFTMMKCIYIPSFILIGFCVSELHAHLCPYYNVWPEAVYCCFTRTTIFRMLLTC